MRLEDLRVYQSAMEVGEEVWSVVEKWSFFQKDTVGKQFVRSADSIAANISEGFGRYHFKDSKLFYYYSRGSLFETKTWLKMANNRKLIENKKFEELYQRLTQLSVQLNNFISTIGKNK